MADNSADIQAKIESPKSVTDMLWPMPVELINEQMKELCPIVITTIDCLPTKFKDANNNILEDIARLVGCDCVEVDGRRNLHTVRYLWRVGRACALRWSWRGLRV